MAEEQFKANLRVTEEDKAARLAAANAKSKTGNTRRGSISLSETVAKGARRTSTTPNDFALKPNTEMSSTLNTHGAGKVSYKGDGYCSLLVRARRYTRTDIPLNTHGTNALDRFKFNDIGNAQKGQTRARSMYELEKSKTQADNLFAQKIRRRSSVKGIQNLTSP